MANTSGDGVVSLPFGQATQALRALVPHSGPVWRRAFTVLDGTAAGTILTDDPVVPRWAVVQEHSDDGTLFLAGELSNDRVAALIDRQLRERPVVICLTEDDPRLGLLPPDPAYDGIAIDFGERDRAVDLEALVTQPDGLRLARVDLELLPRLAWGPWSAPSPEAALKHGIGFCLLDGDVVVSEAFAGPITAGVLEMGTVTHEDYRGRGLARIVCARTIVECERQGHDTWWNAAATNIPSLRLARSFGYRNELPHRVLAWFPPGPA
jgi:GNAT superfamily N-acetyltransferase